MSETFILTYFHTNNRMKVQYQLFSLFFYTAGSYQSSILYTSSVYMSIPITQFSTTPSPPHRIFPPLVSICLCSTSVSQLLPCKLAHLYQFSRFHISALIYDICFSLSDLLHSVWQSLDPSTSQQMKQFGTFLWLSNIPFYICTTTSLSIGLLMGVQVASMTQLL